MGADRLRKNRVECEARPHKMSCHDTLFDLRDGGGRLRNRVEPVGRRALPIARDKRRSPLKGACCAERPKRRLVSPLRKSLRRSLPRSVISQAKRRIFPASGSTLATRTRSSSKSMGPRRIGWGRTTTYGALAKDIGAGPEVARDVGTAMAENPVPLIIPCHRVLAAGGKLGGFSAPGGAATKIRMLKLEGVRLAPPPPVQRSFAF